MATKTTNYNLTKPSGTENADIDVINANMDIIDTALNGKSDTNHTHSNYATKTEMGKKQDPIKGGTGITIGSDGVTIGHTNSIDGRNVGSATSVPVLTIDDQGHISAVTSTTIYPPTTKGTANQYWRSDGDGTGAWTTPASVLTNTDETCVSAKTVFTALQNYAKSSDVSSTYATKSELSGKASTSVATTSANGLMSSTDKSKLNGIESGANKTVVDSALSSTSTNPLQNKVVNQAIYNQSVNLGNQISAKQDKLTAGTGITISGNTISASGGSSEWVFQPSNMLSGLIEFRPELNAYRFTKDLRVDLYYHATMEYQGTFLTKNTGMIHKGSLIMNDSSTISFFQSENFILFPNFVVIQLFVMRIGQDIQLGGEMMYFKGETWLNTVDVTYEQGELFTLHTNQPIALVYTRE